MVQLKKILFFVTMLISSLCSAQIVTNGLIAKYSFNNSNANDEAGNNNGTVNSAVLAQDRFGNSNRAYAFGQGQTITVADVDTLDGMTSGFSLSFWVLAGNISTGSNNLISKFTHCSGSGDDSYNIRINSSGQIWAQLDNSAGNDTYHTSSIAVDDSVWHHVVLVWNRPNTMIYIDGIPDSLGSYSSFNFDFNNSPEVLSFGHQITDGCGGSYNYGELLDDILIYNRALNASEVDSLFNEANPITTGLTTIESATKAIEFFPNPSSGNLQFNANADVEEVEIFNLAGQRLQAIRLQGRQGSFELNLPAGMYLLRSRLHDGRQQTDKVIMH